MKSVSSFSSIDCCSYSAYLYHIYRLFYMQGSPPLFDIRMFTWGNSKILKKSEKATLSQLHARV